MSLSFIQRCMLVWVGGSYGEKLSVTPLRAQSDMGFPEPDGRGSVARASVGPAACLERAPSQVQLAIREIGPTKKRAASRRQECSRQEPNKSFKMPRAGMCAMVGPTDLELTRRAAFRFQQRDAM